MYAGIGFVWIGSGIGSELEDDGGIAVSDSGMGAELEDDDEFGVLLMWVGVLRTGGEL